MKVTVDVLTRTLVHRADGSTIGLFLTDEDKRKTEVEFDEEPIHNDFLAQREWCEKQLKKHGNGAL